MSATAIEWTDKVWNPVTGCSKVSQGCKHCYAERVFSRPYPGRAFSDVRTHPERLTAPLRWRAPRRVFVNSMSDLFHESVPDAFLDKVFAVMELAPQHTFQVLTKRPKRMHEYLGFIRRWRLPNVWLGVSIEDQETADYRIPLLLQTPAEVRWVSAEPLLGPICFEGMFANSNPADGTNALEEIDWLVAGGESGPQARPAHPSWFRTLRDQCAATGVPFFFKQWGEWVPRSACYHTREDGSAWADADPGAEKWPVIRLTEEGHNGRDLAQAHDGADAYMQRVGKKAAGRLLDGREHLEYPA